MPRRPLPLERLRAVECAARSGSFRLAAAELGLTPSAVSHRVSALESELGLRLFERLGRGVQPTRHGRELAEAVRQALDHIGSTWERLEAGARKEPLRISSAPLFAATYVLPFLADWRQSHGASPIRIESSNAVANLEAGACDVAIRVAYNVEQTELCAELLLTTQNIIVASPGLADGGCDPAQLRDGPLLGLTLQPKSWRNAMRNWGIKPADEAPTLWFDSLEAILRQAVEGRGFALVPRQLVRHHLSTGALAALFPEFDMPGPAYWLVTRRGEENRPRIRLFRRWLAARIALLEG
jgi:LysR family transcriptional regulator, glycine cleavage system transcriptional activator